MIVDALAHNRIELCWQPIVSTSDRTAYMYEVLARLRDSRGELHPPADFISQAEYLNLIGENDRRVVDLAIDTGASQRWADAAPRLAVNLSSRSISTDMAERIIRKADESGYPVDRLTIEVTETADPLPSERNEPLAHGGVAVWLMVVTKIADDFHHDTAIDFVVFRDRLHQLYFAQPRAFLICFTCGRPSGDHRSLPVCNVVSP